MGRGSARTCGTEAGRRMIRIIAIADNYLGLIAGARARLAELGISYETLDAVAGWTETYSTKLLAEEPQKYLGPMSFDALMGGLAFKLALIEDPEKLEKLRKHRHFVPRRGPMPNRVTHARYIVRRDTREHMREMGKESGRVRKERIPERKRKSMARKAALTRWRKPRLVEITKRRPSGA